MWVICEYLYALTSLRYAAKSTSRRRAAERRDGEAVVRSSINRTIRCEAQLFCARGLFCFVLFCGSLYFSCRWLLLVLFFVRSCDASSCSQSEKGEEASESFGASGYRGRYCHVGISACTVSVLPTVSSTIFPSVSIVDFSPVFFLSLSSSMSPSVLPSVW